jgi:hypothetical protein
MNYKTYAEAKIANPDCEIVMTGKDWSGSDRFIGTFEALDNGHTIGNRSWVICNPADHCSTLKEFLDAGLKLGDGDKFIGIGGYIVIVKKTSAVNVPDDEDVNRYILSAAALNGGCKIEFIEHKTESWSIYNNTLPLSDLSDELDVKLFRAWRNGGEVQFLTSHNEWVKSKYPFSEPERIYRIKPKSERELFIDKSMEVCKENQHNKVEFMLGKIYDAGARYTDLTQHFGDNI